MGTDWVDQMEEKTQWRKRRKWLQTSLREIGRGREIDRVRERAMKKEKVTAVAEGR